MSNETTREQKLEALVDAQKRLAEAKKAKKRDVKVHNENIDAVETEIEDILAQLED